jgi:hypothetical protein
LDYPKNKEVNQKMAQIMGFNRFQLSNDEWISNLKINLGVLMLLVNGFHDLVILHKVSFIQENVFCLESKLLGLVGREMNADVYRIDPISSSADFETTTPLWRDLKSATTTENVASLVIPDQNPPVFRGQSSLIIPPLVLTTVVDANTLCPASLIPIMSSKLQEFDCTSAQKPLLRPV